MFRGRLAGSVLRHNSSYNHRRRFGTWREVPNVLLDPVPVLRPIGWCIATVSTIYLASAAYDVHQDVQWMEQRGTTWDHPSPLMAFTILDGYALLRHTKKLARADRTERAEFSESQQLIIGTIVANVSVYSLTRLSKNNPLSHQFVHVPVATANRTLLLSTFQHFGLFHLGVNMFALWNFGPLALRSPTFMENTSHFLAFYLSTGIVSSLGHHLSVAWPRRMDRFVPSAGASGSLMVRYFTPSVDYPYVSVKVRSIA
ncbi:hypothetical protein F5Y15DRAFT_376071 [Xylariaceae sp. FL0016]|nr:hypothetical protein F5Y15DRAFT_376071 [Xylariaceae sp. FL0016]